MIYNFKSDKTNTIYYKKIKDEDEFIEIKKYKAMKEFKAMERFDFIKNLIETHYKNEYIDLKEIKLLIFYHLRDYKLDLIDENLVGAIIDRCRFEIDQKSRKSKRWWFFCVVFFVL